MMQSSKALSTLAQTDPQMALPNFPKLVDDLHMIWVNSEMMLIVGGANDVIMRGNSVKRLLPRLFTYLNGQYTLADILFHLAEFSQDAVQDALALLAMRGVVIDGYPDAVINPQIAKGLEAQSLFYGRYMDITRASRHPHDLIHRLQTAHVYLVGRGSGAQGVARELMQMGIGQLTVLPLDGASAWETVGKYAKLTQLSWADPSESVQFLHQTLFLYITDTPSDAPLHELNQLATTHHIPLLVAQLAEGVAQIGHVYYPRQSPCYECAQRQQAFIWQPLAPSLLFTDWTSPEMQIAIGKTALCALSALTRLIKPNAMEIFAYDAEAFQWHTRSVHLLTGCQYCQTEPHIAGDVLLGEAHLESFALLYHQNVRIHAFQANPKEHQIHYSPDVQQTMRQAQKGYDGAHRVMLPNPTFTTPFELPYHLPIEPTISPSIDINRLSTLLRTVAEGRVIEENGVLRQARTTASGGGMISQNLYFINWGVGGLEAGCYYFNPSGWLEVLQHTPLQTELTQCLPPESRPPHGGVGAIIQTNALARLESKYGSRAFLYALLDAGVMAHSIAYVGALLHMEVCQIVNFYDDRLNTLLGLHSDNEAATSIFFLDIKGSGDEYPQ